MTGSRHLVDWLHRRREVERVASVALFGTLVSWLTYELIFLINPIEPRATTSWFLTYLTAVVRQHHLHRIISFPGPKANYAATFRRQVVVNGTLLCLGGGLNYVLVEIADMHHRLAWLICMALVATSNYLSMKFFVFRRHQR